MINIDSTVPPDYNSITPTEIHSSETFSNASNDILPLVRENVELSSITENEEAPLPPLSYNEVELSTITENEKNCSLPPSYSEAELAISLENYITELPNNNEVELPANKISSTQERNVITTQPESQNLSTLQNLQIRGLINGDREGYLTKNISSFILSKNYLAFNKKVCCHPFFSCNKGMSCKNILLPKEKLIVFNTDNKSQSTIEINKQNNMKTKSIVFTPDNKKIISLCDNDTSSVLYVNSSTDHTEKDMLLNNENFSNGIKIYCPMVKIYAIYCDNDSLYAIGIEKNTLQVQKTNMNNFSTYSEIINWQTIVFLPITITNPQSISATFSKTGSLLFVLAENKTLSLFAKNINWGQVKVFYDIDSLPKDINSSEDTMAFIEGDSLIIRDIVSDKKISKYFKNAISTVCFIPETKNLLVFTKSAQMMLLAQSENNLNSYFIKNKKEINYSVKEAYFDYQDPTKLTALVDNYKSNYGYVKSVIFPVTIVAVFAEVAFMIGCIDHLCNVGPCCCSCANINSATPNADPFACLCSCCTYSMGEQLKHYTLMGTYAGLSCAAVSVFATYVYDWISRNSIPDDLITIEKKE